MVCRATSTTVSVLPGKCRPPTCTPGQSHRQPVEPCAHRQMAAAVPAHRGSIRAAYSNPKILTLSAGVQFVGSQFDDDLNQMTRRLPKFALPTWSPRAPSFGTSSCFVGVQNLLMPSTSSAPCHDCRRPAPGDRRPSPAPALNLSRTDSHATLLTPFADGRRRCHVLPGCLLGAL